MLGNLNAWIHAALAPRGLLVLNHLLLAEPVAREKLRAHVGKAVELKVQGLPQWAEPWPSLCLRVTPAGLFEAEPGEPMKPVDLTLTVQARPPWEMAGAALQGHPPEVAIAGDSAFATDLNWLAKNLRWDMADDLQRWVGPGPAQAVAQMATGAAGAAAEVANVVRSLMKALPGPRP